jgi:hypothetical protein
MAKPNNKLAICTISDPGYVPLVRTMFESVREHYEDADLYLFMTGKGTDEKLGDGIHVIYIEDVFRARDLEQRLSYYLGVELACSIRPKCFESLFDKGYDRLIYLDPDVYVFRRMTEIDKLFDDGVNGVLTPHALQSITSEIALEGGDQTLLRVGIFNLGFLALNRTPETLRMLDWWGDKLKWQCICDLKGGLFVDQKWLEFLPVYFEGFHILRLPTYNLAPWNAEHYTILSDDEDEGKFYVDDKDQPVAFMHFSGVRRTRQHYAKMMDALEFYLERLSKWESSLYSFQPYRLELTRGGLVWDKICTMLYKEMVRDTRDYTSSPLSAETVYAYVTSDDPLTGMPRYLRKVFEIFPYYAAAVLCDGDTLSFDNVIVEVTKKDSPYAGCVYPATVAGLKALRQPSTPAAEPKRRGIMFRAVRAVYRRLRGRAVGSQFARRVYFRLRRYALHVFRVNEARHDLNATLLKVAIRLAKDADLVK